MSSTSSYPEVPEIWSWSLLLQQEHKAWDAEAWSGTVPSSKSPSRFLHQVHKPGIPASWAFLFHKWIHVPRERPLTASDSHRPGVWGSPSKADVFKSFAILFGNSAAGLHGSYKYFILSHNDEMQNFHTILYIFFLGSPEVWIFGSFSILIRIPSFKVLCKLHLTLETTQKTW